MISTREDKELSTSIFNSIEELREHKKELLLGICPTLPQGLLEKYSKLTVVEGEIAAKVYLATQEGVETVLQDVKRDHPHLRSLKQKQLAKKRLSEFRGVERNRICNVLGLYTDNPCSLTEVPRLLENVWGTYQKMRRKQKAFEDLRNPSNRAYLKRNQILEELGYNSYHDYLKSALWKRIRKKVLVRDNYVCCACSAQAREVHHRSYDRIVLLGEFIAPLISLCSDCHTHIEFTPEGRKRTFIESSKACNNLVNRGRQQTGRLSLYDLRQEYPSLPDSRRRKLAGMTANAQRKALNRLAKNRRRKQRRRASQSNSESLSPE